MRELEAMLLREEISYSRMVKMLNEKAAEPEKEYAVGYVTCDLCNHYWLAVRLAALDKLECPNCNNMTTFKTDIPLGLIP